MDNFFYRNLKRSYPIVASAKGVWVEDTAGKKYLDGSSGAIVSNIGHGVFEVNEAIQEQLAKVAFAHTSQFVSEPGLKLAQMLCELAPSNFKAGRAYFVSGGSEAIETALKMARGYWVEKGELSRHIVISRRNSYHGSTQGALAATGHPARRKPYLPMLKEEPHISPVHPYRCPCGVEGACDSRICAENLADELESAIVKAGADKVMAFIAEPVVGAALGASCPADGYWQRIREICTRHGVLLISDEVMTGLGRCGFKFGLDRWGVQPDMIALGKGLSAGYMPLGAVLASERVAGTFASGTGVFEHGFTYSGHPLSCAAGVAVLSYKQKHGLIARVADKQSVLFKGLQQLADRFDIIGDVRGVGFLAGMEIVEDRRSKRPFSADIRVGLKLATEAANVGLLVYPGSGSIDGVSGDHIMIAPPFTISDDELQLMFDRLAVAFEKVTATLLAPKT